MIWSVQHSGEAAATFFTDIMYATKACFSLQLVQCAYIEWQCRRIEHTQWIMVTAVIY